jgi:uncharacterized protein (DUF983 family)|tara:strand:- start:194 stop:445 length:252 start_codon:yes stop_codon:yes gene_type:complete
MTDFGKGPFGKGIKFKTEVTNGECPVCSTVTIFVSIFDNIYRCMTCGADTEQKVNGLISFMPISSTGGKIPTMKVSIDPPDGT